MEVKELTDIEAKISEGNTPVSEEEKKKKRRYNLQSDNRKSKSL